MAKRNFLSIYYHIPFCKRKCAYCNFYSFSFSQKESRKFKESTLRETRNLAEFFSSKTKIRSLYFGGGTPTYFLKFYPDFLDEIIEILKPFFTSKTEITCETNLEEISPYMLNTLKSSSINRLSVGLQTTIPRLRKLIGRSEQLNIEKLKLIPYYFSNWSVDIIYGIPSQTLKDLEKTLEDIFKMVSPPHISAYLLEIKKGTPLSTKFLPSLCEEEIISHYQFLCSYLRGKNYTHYEVSNFAIPPFFSYHNLAYWNEKNYLALGPGGWGKLENLRYSIDKHFNYNIQIEDDKTSLLTYVIMKLRTKSGLNLKALERKFNLAGENWVTEKIRWFEEIGFGKRKGDRFFFEEKDWLVLNSLLAEFFT